MINKKKLILIIISIVIIIALVFSAIHFINNYKQKNQAIKDLFIAVENDDLNNVKQVIEKYPDLVDAMPYKSSLLSIWMDHGNSTILLDAIRLSRVDIIKYLVENGADVNKSEGTMKLYPLNQVLTHAFGELGPIRFEMAWFFIEHGADLNVEQQYYNVPYSIVTIPLDDDDIVLNKQSLELMKYVISNGVRIDAPPTAAFGETVDRSGLGGINKIIGMAANRNYKLILEYFLDTGMYELNEIVSEKAGTTSLIEAVKGNSYATCSVLLKRGADTTIVDNDGKTAYDYAVENQNEKIIKLFKDYTS